VKVDLNLVERERGRLLRSAYYEKMKLLAREVRSDFGLITPRVLKSDLRRIYKKYGIRIDLWPHGFRKVRGAYFTDENGVSVLIDRRLPDDPLIFTLAHELKHHLVDSALGLSYCGSDNETEPIEIGAEVFAAELIFPERDFVIYLTNMGVGYGECKPENLVRLKHETKTTLSYMGLVKRAEFLGFVAKDAFKSVRFQKLEEQIYGVPFYKRFRR
jgi:Zn-dependent peptidase ImmA (M78 family)